MSAPNTPDPAIADTTASKGRPVQEAPKIVDEDEPSVKEMFAELKKAIAEIEEKQIAQINQLSEQIFNLDKRLTRRMDEVELSGAIVRSDMRRNFGLPAEQTFSHRGEADGAKDKGSHYPRIHPRKIAGPHFP